MQIDLIKTQRLINWTSRKLYYHNAKINQRRWTVKRGEVYFVDLGENIGSEENKLRPCVVIQSNSYNFHSPVFICAIISNSLLTIPDIQIPITENYTYIDAQGNKKTLSGTIDLGQIKTVGKERIISKVGTLNNEMRYVDEKLLNAFGLSNLIISRDNLINSLKGKVDYLNDKLSKK